MNKLKENELLEFMEEAIRKYYESIKATGKEDRDKAKYIEGIITSVVVLGGVSKEQLQVMIDAWHMEVFGVERKQRRLEDAVREGGDKWLYFDRPPTSRN